MFNGPNADDNIREHYPGVTRLNAYDWYKFIHDDASVDNSMGAFIINLNPNSEHYGHVWAYSSSDDGIRGWIANSFTGFLEVLTKDADLFLHQERYQEILEDSTGMVDFYNMTILTMEWYYCPQWIEYAAKTGRVVSEEVLEKMEKSRKQ